MPTEEYYFFPVNRFVINPYKFYLSTSSRREYAFAEVDMETHKFNSFGNHSPSNNKSHSYIPEYRHIFKWNNQYICVSDRMPIIEIYDSKSKQKTGEYNYLHIPEVKSILRYIEELKTQTDYSMINSDAYLCNDKLYILLIHHLDNIGISMNKILEIELLPTIRATNIFRLPGRGYSTFCVSGDSIYAFNVLLSQIELLVK